MDAAGCSCSDLLQKVEVAQNVEPFQPKSDRCITEGEFLDGLMSPIATILDKFSLQCCLLLVREE